MRVLVTPGGPGHQALMLLARLLLTCAASCSARQRFISASSALSRSRLATVSSMAAATSAGGLVCWLNSDCTPPRVAIAESWVRMAQAWPLGPGRGECVECGGDVVAGLGQGRLGGREAGGRHLLELAVGLGLRQGEVFGLAVDDVDFLRGVVEVQRQVKILAGNKMFFGLPKGYKVRTVPLPSSVRDVRDVRDVLAAYLTDRPAKQVALAGRELDGEPVSVRLILSTREGGAMNRNYFNSHIWKPALNRASVEPSRDNGMHALRHHYATSCSTRARTSSP